MAIMDPEAEDYIKSIFDKTPSEYELMEKYLPGFVEGNVKMRRAIYPHPKKDKEAAIPRKYRELIMIALEVGMGRGGGKGAGGLPGVHHTRWAVSKAGATPQEIAEAVAIATYLCGQPSVVDYGYHCIKAAEEEYKKIRTKK